MKLFRLSSQNRFLGVLLFALAIFKSASAASAALYKVGDVVENFSLINRDTGQAMQLTDFEGKIVLFDWFAWWCPFCQAAAPQLLAGIDNYYRDRNGSLAGIPVVHVGVNLQSNQETQTQNFINRAGLEIVLQDFNRTVTRRFANSGQPIFAIINGVANSPGHKQWELIYSRLGYGQTQFPVADFRAAIDSVPAPPAVTPVTITSPPQSQTVSAGNSASFSVTATGTPPLSYQWQLNGTDVPNATSATLVLDNIQVLQAGDYDVVVSNAGGSVTSQIATLAIISPPARPATLSRIRKLMDDTVEFDLAGEVGRAYRIEVSEDLVNWLTLTAVTTMNASQTVRDAGVTNITARFYRAISQ